MMHSVVLVSSVVCAMTSAGINRKQR
jgi:hypothetical protein